MSRTKNFQDRVSLWIQMCFGIKPDAIKRERNHRFLEESLELVQSLGCTKDEALELLEYVYSRPAGDPKQEVGGTMVTLAGLCAANDFDMEDLAEDELDRVWKNIEKIRLKRQKKNEESPLP